MTYIFKPRSISGKKLCSSCGLPLGKGAAMIIETLNLYFHIQCFRVRTYCFSLQTQFCDVFWHRSVLRNASQKFWRALSVRFPCLGCIDVWLDSILQKEGLLSRIPLGCQIRRSRKVCAICPYKTVFVAKEHILQREAENGTLGRMMLFQIF